MPPWELIVDLLLQLVLPAAVTSGVVLALTAKYFPASGQDLGVAIAAAAGIAAGNWYSQLLPYLPQLEDTGWPWLLILALVALAYSGLLYAFVGQEQTERPVLILIGVVWMTWFLVPGDLRNGPWMLGFGTLALITTFILERTAAKIPSPLTPLVWAVILLGGAAGVLLYSHSARLSNGATLFASVLLGMATVTYWKPLPLRAVGLAMGAFLPGLMISGFNDTFSEVPWQSFALAAAVPLGLGLHLLSRAEQRTSNWQQFALAIILPLIPAAIAIALAIQAEGWELGY